MKRAREERRLCVLAGVDEAGLGSLLGPLAIGWCAIRAPGCGPDEPWKKLFRTIARQPERAGRRIVVADSKLVFARTPLGERRLETTALAFLGLLRPDGRPPVDGRFLLDGEPAPAPELISRSPWYALLGAPLPRHVEARAIELKCAVLGRSLERCGYAFADAGVRIVPEAELNASFDETDNKALTVWHKTEGVLRRLWSRFAPEGADVFVDQQGGRRRYGPLLATSFPDASVRETERGRDSARYELAERGGGERFMRVLFRDRAEATSFPTALASCLAKYGRETCMAAFNAWFVEREPSLRPTAGYRQDGFRFLRDAATVVKGSGLPLDVLVRGR